MAANKTNLTRRAFIGGAAAFGAVSIAVPRVALAEPTSADVQAQADAARVKLDDMQKRLNQASDDYYTALKEHDTATTKMDEAQAKIDDNNAKISELQESLGGRARGMYRDGQITFLDVLLGSSSFDDFLKNWDILQTLNESDADLVAQTKTLREDNEKQKAEYQAQADTAKQKMDEAEAIKNEAEGLVEQYQAEVDSLDAEVAELVEQERQAAAEAEAERQRQEFEQQQQQEQQESNNEAANDGGNDTNVDDGNDYTPPANNGNSGGGSSSGGSTGGGGTPNSAALGVAEGFLGVPYVWGGDDPSGFDCSGLTSYCYRATGYEIGRTTYDQYATANYIMSLSEAEPGDVLYNGGHVGICASSGGGSYIHAPAPGQVVSYSSWSQFYCALRW